MNNSERKILGTETLNFSTDADGSTGTIFLNVIFVEDGECFFGGKTDIVIQLRLRTISKCDKTQIVTKRKL